MSWWIYLVETENGKKLDTDTIRSEGGTQMLGGTTVAELSVTYNYSKHFDFNKLNQLGVKAAAILLKKTDKQLNNRIGTGSY